MAVRFFGGSLKAMRLLHGRSFASPNNKFEEEELNKVLRMSEIDLEGFFKAMQEHDNKEPYKHDKILLGKAVKNILMRAYSTGEYKRSKSFFTRRNQLKFVLHRKNWYFHSDLSFCYHGYQQAEPNSVDFLNALTNCIIEKGGREPGYHFDFASFNSDYFDLFVREWLEGLGWKYDKKFKWYPNKTLVLTERKQGLGCPLILPADQTYHTSIYR